VDENFCRGKVGGNGNGNGKARGAKVAGASWVAEYWEEYLYSNIIQLVGGGGME